MDESRSRASLVANTAVLVTGLALFGISLWGASGMTRVSGESSEQVPWIAHMLAGALAITGMFMAQRARLRTLGRVALGIGAAVLLWALLQFQAAGGWAWLSLILPALVLLAAIPMLRVMPAPRGTAT